MVLPGSQSLLLLLVLLCLNPGSGRAQITVATAANVLYALEEIRADFLKDNKAVTIKTVIGSSGKLTSQIRNGAPFDVFISADTEFPDSLNNWGYTAAPPRVYGYGVLVLWTVKDLDLSKGLSLLGDPSITKIALPDPKRAPYGREALKALKFFGVNVDTEKKLVYGENISQVSQYILTQNVDIGFSAKGVVLAGNMGGKGTWADVDSTLYDDIAQSAAITSYGAKHNPMLAKKFYEFLFSSRAQSILKTYGYAIP